MAVNGIIFVTGATGFLGRHLVPLLTQAGFRVRALVRPESAVPAYLRASMIEIVNGDLQDRDSLQQSFGDSQYVIHAGGLFRFWGYHEQFERVNVQGTANMLEVAARNSAKRFVHISTVAVVGAPAPDLVIDEQYPCQPIDAYQRSKFDAENLARMYFRAVRLPTVVLRPGAYYGPGGHYAWNRLFFEDPFKGLRIQVHHGKRITFPVFVADVAKAALAALALGGGGEVYNVSGDPLTQRQATDTISRLARISRFRLNCPEPLMVWLADRLTDMARHTRREPYYPINLAKYVFRDWHVSSAKARAELGFVPTPFEEGARQTVGWYREIGMLR